MVVLIVMVLFLKSLYNYRDIIHPLLFHLYRQLLGYKSYIIPSQTIPKEGERQIPPRSIPDGPADDRHPSMDHILAGQSVIQIRESIRARY